MYGDKTESHTMVACALPQLQGWRRWAAVCRSHPELRVLVSHLGLPEAPPQGAAATWTAADYRQQLEKVLALAEYPGVRVKLSGFYALTKPGHEYPHADAHGYV